MRDFCANVAGWKPEPDAMGDYHDYSMISPDSGTGVVSSFYWKREM